MECEEPKCRYPAAKDWKGRKVCEDHYQSYKDKWEKIYFETTD